MTAFGPKEISEKVLGAYPHAGFFPRLLIRLRPYICPFHELADVISRPGSVLEVGCGYGMMTVLLAHIGKVVTGTGIDISEKSIAVAKRAVLPKGCNIKFRRIMPGESWPDGAYDNVLSIDVLHHIPRADQRAFIKNLCRAARSGTVVFKDVSPKPHGKLLGASFMISF